ncbi:MAG TPA: hypothetical protein VFV33_24125, partial [Gemmatimonadaceae bacterium]|nr:hypothetical protein [Gemmatimonadaceae bacterium]
FTFVDSSLLGLALYGRATLPVGPSRVDLIPPSLSDGTLDAEATFIAEIRATRNFRIMINLGYLHHGVRPDASIRDFDVPDALRYDVAATLNLGDRALLGVEFVGRSYLRSDLTPVWNDNPHQWEVIPHARLETVPNLVLEAALGIAVSPHLQEIYTVRGLLGFTYEFDLGGGDRGDRDEGRRGRGRGRKRGH